MKSTLLTRTNITPSLIAATAIYFSGAIIAAWAFIYLSAQREKYIESLFNSDAQVVTGRISSECEKLQDLLNQLRAFMQDANDNITAKRFDDFVVAADIMTRYPEIQSVNYETSVTSKNIASFEKSFNLKVYPNSTNELHEVITFGSPVNAANIGLDIGSSQRKQSPTMPMLRGLGVPVASLAPYPNKTGPSGIGLRLGLYKLDSPRLTFADRTAAFKGSVGLGFRINPFFVRIIGESSLRQMHVEVHRLVSVAKPYEVEPPSSENLIFDSTSTPEYLLPPSLSGPTLTKSVAVMLGMSTMQVKFTANRGQYTQGFYFLPHITATLIGGIAALIGSWIISLSSHRRRFDSTVKRLRRRHSFANIRRETQQRALFELLEDERRFIGQELHDHLGQELAAARYSTHHFAHVFNSQSLPHAHDITLISQTLERLSKRLRLLARGIFPVTLDSDGINEALSDLARTTEEHYGIECTVIGTINFDEKIEGAINLYRIVQEAITNAVRHGRSTKITILCSRDVNKFTMHIIDNGTFSLSESQKTSGMGMRTMRSRASLLGMLVEIKRNADGGTTISVTQRGKNAAD